MVKHLRERNGGFYRKIALFMVLSILLYSMAVSAVALSRPTIMPWEEFYDAYQAASTSGGTVVLTGNVTVSEESVLERIKSDESELPPITVECGRYGFVVRNHLTVRDESLTFVSNDGRSPIFVVPGTLSLYACQIKVEDSAVIYINNTNGVLDMSQATNVDISAQYHEDTKDFVPVYTASTDPLNLKNLSIHVVDGQYAISTFSKVSFTQCRIVVEGANAVAPVEHGEVEWDEETVLIPAISVDEEANILKAFYLPELFDCNSGVAPENLMLPQTTKAIVLSPNGESDTMDLPIDWDLTTLSNPIVAGAYTLIGTPKESLLDGQALSNPERLTTTLELKVYDAGAVTTLKADWKDFNTNTMIMLKGIPHDAEILSVKAFYRRGNGSWKPVLISNEDDVNTDNLLEERDQYGRGMFRFRLPVTTGTLQLKVAIEGSIYAGTSNVVSLKLSDPAPDADWGESEGDRGGGGRDEASRPAEILPPVVEESPSSSEPLKMNVPLAIGKESSSSNAEREISENETLEEEQTSVESEAEREEVPSSPTIVPTVEMIKQKPSNMMLFLAGAGALSLCAVLVKGILLLWNRFMGL